MSSMNQYSSWTQDGKKSRKQSFQPEGPGREADILEIHLERSEADSGRRREGALRASELLGSSKRHLWTLSGKQAQPMLYCPLMRRLTVDMHKEVVWGPNTVLNCGASHKPTYLSEEPPPYFQLQQPELLHLRVAERVELVGARTE